MDARATSASGSEVPAPGQSPMFSTERLVGDRKDVKPVIVVGLPRSGSSYLTHVLHHVEGLYVFDDYYALQKAQAISLDRPFTDDEVRRYIDRLSWETRARIKFEVDFNRPDLSLTDVDRAEQALVATFDGESPMWFDVAAEWLHRLAQHHGRDQWGYKTPQDFLHLDRLAVIWPRARIVHLLRDPRQIMESLKNLEAFHGSDGDPRQYHPVVYGLYWRMSYRRTASFFETSQQRSARVRFEDLRDEPADVVRRLADLVDANATVPAAPERVNSSTAGERRTLTPSEIWLVQRLCRREMEEAGYEMIPARLRLRDLPELCRVTAGFIGFQLGRLARDREKRASAGAFLRRLLFPVD